MMSKDLLRHLSVSIVLPGIDKMELQRSFFFWDEQQYKLVLEGSTK